MLVIFNLPLGLCTFPTTHGGAVGAIRPKAALTPSLSRKDKQELPSVLKTDSYTNKSGLFGSKGTPQTPWLSPALGCIAGACGSELQVGHQRFCV